MYYDKKGVSKPYHFNDLTEKEKMKMKKKAMAAVLMMSLAAGSSLTVCAAPETKADGTVFDAEYYAQMYPDVVAELGTGADAMYQHYVTFGKAEGRLAVSPDAAAQQTGNDGFDAVFYAQMYPDVVAALGTDAGALYQHYVNFGKAEGRLANSGTAPLPAVTAPVTPQTVNHPQVIGTLGVVGATYQLPTWGIYDDIDMPEKNKVIMATFNTEPTEECFSQDLESLAPLATEGYEWRFINYRAIGLDTDDPYDRWWADYYTSYDVENSKDWQYVENGVADLDYHTFTVIQDGAEYTHCKSRYGWGYQYGGVAAQEGAYFLLPKGFSGKVYFRIKASKPDGADLVNTVADNDHVITFVF